MWKHVLKSKREDFVCDSCKLFGDETTDAWEDFLNGQWTKAKPDKIGWYPVKRQGKIIYLETIVVGNSISWVSLEYHQRKRPPVRWSVPVPKEL